ncbi:MAG: DUF1217 domain-containing protein [Pseudomonadota bacterium]
MVAGIPGASSLVAWNAFIKDPETQLSQFRKTPNIQRQIENFTEKFSQFESVEDLVNDYQVMQVVLSAFQLEDQINFTARNQKIIEEPTSGPEAANSLVNQLVDQRYRDLAETFDFQGRGDTVFASPVVLNEIIDRFVVNEFEKTLGESNPGLREAAFFSRSVGDFTNTFQLLSNRALRSVIDTGLGLPPEFAQADLDQQVRLIEGRLDVEEFFADDVDDATAFLLRDAQENSSRLSPLTANSNAALNAVQQITDRIDEIQQQISDVEKRTNPALATPAQQAEITFQNGQLGNTLSVNNLLTKAAGITDGVADTIAELRDLAFATGQLNPVGDAAQIAANKVQFQALANSAINQIASATENNIETGVPESLLEPVPGPGATNKTYQLTSTSPVVNVTGFDLGAFTTALANADAQFQADNFTGADLLIVGSRQDLYDARISLADQLEAFDKAVDGVTNFAASVDQATFVPGFTAVQQSETNAGDAFNIVTDLRNIAQELSDPTQSTADRADFEALYIEKQADLDALLNPPSADNLLTTNASLTIAINGVLNFETTNGIDFNGAGYPEFDPAAPPPPQATAAALAATFDTYLTDIQDLRTQLNQDRLQLQKIRDQFDPFGSVIIELQSLTDDLETIRESARTDFGRVDPEDEDEPGLNLLDQNSADGKVQLANGTNFVTRGIADFTGQVEQFIQSANTTIKSDRVAGNAELTTALQNLTNMRLQLQADIRPQTQALDNFAQVIADNSDPEETETSEFANPYQDANAFTLQFIQRYLALSDQNNTAQSQDPILQLLNAGNGGDNQGAAGIVNLLV